MHIIMGSENAKLFAEKYTVLELDTIKFMPAQQVIPAYCVIENIAITDIPKIESMGNLHTNLLENYRKKDWNYCEQAIEHLLGFWGGEIDSFYTDLLQRIAKYKEQDPGESWDGTIEKHTTSE